MLEACKVQKYPFTKNQDVPEIDWQRFLNDTATQMISEQTPQKLEQVRDRFYELLSQGVPSDVIFKGLVQILSKNCDITIKAKVLNYASLYEHRMQMGSKAIFHLEAFAAQFMSIYKRFLNDNIASMDLDDFDE